LLLHGLKGCRAERMGETAAILLLLPGERIEAKLKIARHQPLHAVAIEADQLAQEADGKEVRSSAFLLDDDLGQHRVREIFAGLCIIDDEVPLRPHHFGEVFKRHIGARVGVIEPAVRVFLDDDRAALLVGIPCHVSLGSLALGGNAKAIHTATARSLARSLCPAPKGFPHLWPPAKRRLPLKESLRYELRSPAKWRTVCKTRML